MTQVMVFAPSPILTVTIEDHPVGPDVHLHAGGQGVWQARMLRRLGVSVTMCCVLTGESGRALRHLLDDEGIMVTAVEREGRGGAYIHDRRKGERIAIVETGGQAISRHDLDELYSLTIGAGLDADLAILSGPASDDALPSETYRRLATDLRRGGSPVLVDLSGERMDAALEGGVDVLKVSDEELLADGLVHDRTPESLIAAIQLLHERGAETVILTRSDEPLLVFADGALSEISVPTMTVTDTRGAGDSFTAGVAASLASGESLLDAVALGAAAGALNVTRHGLGTGDPATIAKLRRKVAARAVPLPGQPEEQETPVLSLEQLASMGGQEPEA